MKDIIFNPLLNLSNKGRYSGTYLAKPENTSDHIAQVGFYALLIGNEINKRCKQMDATIGVVPVTQGNRTINIVKKTIQVDMGTLALKALVHDIDELSSADIPRTTKYSSEHMRELFHELETQTVKDVSAKYDFDQLYTVWENAKDTSIEGYIIKISDLLTVVHKTVEEVSVIGNKNMLKVASEVLDQVKKENDKLTLDKSYHDVVKLVFAEIYITCIKILQQLINDNRSEVSEDYLKFA